MKFKKKKEERKFSFLFSKFISADETTRDIQKMFPFKTRRTLKRHGEELLRLPEDVVELILERLPVKSLLRFRTVSKKLKSAIDS